MKKSVQPDFTGIYSFLGLPMTDEIDEDVDCVLYGMPFDIGTSNRPGTRFGPKTIRKYGSCKPYHEELDLDIFDEFKAIDSGDFEFEEGYIVENMASVISELGKILEKDVVTIGVGGDHTLAYPELYALKQKYGPLAFVHFDSHTDTWYTPHQDGTTSINHGTPFRLAIEQGCIAEGHAIQLGMRGGLNADDDHQYAFDHGVKIIPGNELHDIGMEKAAQEIRDTVGDMPVFVTFDIDFLDPAYAPGTGTPVIGGFTTAEAITLLRKALPGLNIVGMDLVEVAPEHDPAEITECAAKAILREYLAILSYNKKQNAS